MKNHYATFRLHAGIKNFAVDLPAGTNVQQAVLEIVRRYPVLQKDWLDETGELHAHVHILVDGNEVNTLPDQLETQLRTETVLDFFPPVAGG
ncbi:MAG: MoaD family protein [Chloroflexi bacterium]|nr:MoaD family protein [Chloroflexota bacterium]